MQQDAPYWLKLLDNRKYQKWLAERPPLVRELLTEFPFGTKLTLDGADWFVFGATEDGQLVVVPGGSPDYHHAMAERKRLCATHLRDGEVHFEHG